MASQRLQKRQKQSHPTTLFKSQKEDMDELKAANLFYDLADRVYTAAMEAQQEAQTKLEIAEGKLRVAKTEQEKALRFLQRVERDKGVIDIDVLSQDTVSVVSCASTNSEREEEEAQEEEEVSSLELSLPISKESTASSDVDSRECTAVRRFVWSSHRRRPSPAQITPRTGIRMFSCVENAQAFALQEESIASSDDDSEKSIVFCSLSDSLRPIPAQITPEPPSSSARKRIPLRISTGRTREQLNRIHSVLRDSCNLFGKFAMSAISTKNGKVSHIVMNDKWNDLAKYQHETQVFMLGTGVGKHRQGVTLRDNAATPSSPLVIPLFHAPVSESRGDNLIYYVGHWKLHSHEQFDSPTEFKGEPRQAVFRFTFMCYKQSFGDVIDNSSILV